MKPFPRLTIEQYNAYVQAHSAIDSAKIQKQQFDDQKAAIERGEKPRPMLPLTSEIMAEHPIGIFGYHHEEGDLVGYGAITQEYTADRTIEIGGLVTIAKYRKQGYMHELLQQVYQRARIRYLGWTAVVFANENSLPIFDNQPWFERIDPDDAPLQARALCQTCPGYELACGEGKKCCDTIFIGKVSELGKK